MSDEQFRDLKVETLLAYYEAARAEILERLNIRANIAVLYIGAIGAVAGYALGAPLERFYLAPTVIAFLASECVNKFETPVAGSLVSNAALPRVRAAGVLEG